MAGVWTSACLFPVLGSHPQKWPDLPFRYPQADWPETGSDVSCMLDPGSAFVALQVALADVVSVFSHALTDATQEGRDGFCDISKRMEAYSSL